MALCFFVVIKRIKNVIGFEALSRHVFRVNEFHPFGSTALGDGKSVSGLAVQAFFSKYFTETDTTQSCLDTGFN